jgi:glycosyltransferase involved in cell wall biosynthesis
VKKVMHVITTIERGGAENQLVTLVQEQVKLGLKVTILPLKGQAELVENFEYSGAKVDLSIFNRPILYQVQRLRKLIPGDCLVHAHLPRAELLVAIINPKRFIFSRHNTEAFYPRAPLFFSRILSRFVAWRADDGIAISEAVRNFLYTSKEIKKSYPLWVVPYGTPSRHIVNQSRVTEIREKFGISDKDFVIGTIARLAPQKDLTTLLHAFSAVCEKDSDAKLMVIGDGPDKFQLLAISKELQIDSRLIWVGRTSDIYEHLALMNVFVLTSLYEGFGLVLIEAIVSGCPVVAANNSAIPEVLGTHHSGLAETSNPEDFAKKILRMRDPIFRSNVLTHQATRLAIFDPANMAHKITKVYMRN